MGFLVCLLCPYLLVLFELQLDGGLDAVAGVLVGLLQGQVHQVFVVRPRQVPTRKDDDVGQDLSQKHTHTHKYTHAHTQLWPQCSVLTVFDHGRFSIPGHQEIEGV